MRMSKRRNQAFKAFSLFTPLLLLLTRQPQCVSSFVLRPSPGPSPGGESSSRAISSRTNKVHLLFATPLPSGISPFEKSKRDIQGDIRKLAARAIDQAISDGVDLLEIDFPPLLGGDKAKTQFDDFDNLSELNANRDWCVQLVPLLKRAKFTWLVLPDDKECELAKNEWTGQLYRKNTAFTSIRAACESVGGGEGGKNQKFKKAWGSSFAETVNKLQGGDGILADSSTLDELDPTSQLPRLQLVCQPGNGGPVEDWINVEQLHNTAAGDRTTCVVNGALDKVRDGYYPAIFFPALAKSTPFYKDFQPVFILKPISDKGVYGWLYRVYPEPWQVILQTARQTGNDDQQTVVKVQETVALVSDTRPTYAKAVQALLSQSAKVA